MPNSYEDLIIKVAIIYWALFYMTSDVFQTFLYHESIDFFYKGSYSKYF